jgi:hypothetical protein
LTLNEGSKKIKELGQRSYPKWLILGWFFHENHHSSKIVDARNWRFFSKH